MLNPYVILGTAGAWLASIILCGWLMYARGHDDMRNAVTEQQLTQANSNITGMKANDAKAAKAGEDHDVKTQTVHDTTREIVRTVTIPADADPYLPVGFVRLFDRSASRSIGADPYPGKSDGDASDVRVSEAASLLVGDFDKCETNRVQLADLIAYVRSEQTPTPAPKPSWLDSLNPFPAAISSTPPIPDLPAAIN